MRVFHLLLPVLAVAGSAAATFVMCVEPKGVCNGTKVDLDVNPKADSVKGCAIFCQGEDAFDWSFFGNHGECVCGHKSPDPAFEAKALRKGTNNTCPAHTFEADYLNTNYKFAFCHDTVSFHLSLPLVTTDLAECFTYCAGMGDKYMAILGTPQSRPPNISCICGPNDSAQVVKLGHRVPCAKNSSAYYELGASPSLSAKRMLRVMAAEKRRLTGVCPETFEACMVPGSDSFECIDPMEELESCGGCVDGHFEDTTRTPSGIDCTTLPGVSPGHVMCQQGACVVSECEVGYRLVDTENGGACVPLLRQQDKRAWPWHPTGERAATVVMPRAPAPQITRVPVAVETKSERITAEVKRLGKVVWVSGGSLFKSRAWWPWGEEKK